MPYMLKRVYQDPDKPAEIVGEVDTLEEAQEHCNDPETASKTAQGEEGRRRTREFGEWFDCYMEIR